MLSSGGSQVGIELHRLISSGELSRLLESCNKSTPRLSSSASVRTANFAQFSLPLEEIQRWIAEQSDSVQSEAKARDKGGMSCGTSKDFAQMAPGMLSPIEALADAALLQKPVDWQHDYAKQRSQAEHMLYDLERRTQMWVQQASTMQAE